MIQAASIPAASNPSRHRPGTRWHVAAGLLAVLLAWLGITLAAGQFSPAPSVAGLSTVDAVSRRAPLLLRDRAPTKITHRELDPPRADRPAGVALPAGRARGLVAGAIICAIGIARDVAVAAPPRAFFPRGPPGVVRADAA